MNSMFDEEEGFVIIAGIISLVILFSISIYFTYCQYGYMKTRFPDMTFGEYFFVGDKIRIFEKEDIK